MTALLEDLHNIFRSLDQYSRSERGIRYVALVGHFSAGKSSTINNLLSEGDHRAVGLNPTDQGVTFITHSENGKKILAAESKGELQVQVSLIDNEMLRDCVLLDTPGTGDPSKVGAMVKDILPLASMLLYLVSAANPFDDSDVPTMAVVSDELRHIPLKFVITRSDEFRKDHLQPLSAENVDGIKMAQFAAEFVARLRKEGFIDKLTVDDLVFIDNQSDYGIEKLRQLAIFDELDTGRIHLNTLHFYIKKVTSVRNKFVEWSGLIDRNMSGLLEKASKNRAKFDENTGISTHELSKFWTTNYSELVKRVEEDAASLSGWIDESKAIDAPESAGFDLLTDGALNQLKDDLVQRLAEAAEASARETFRRYAQRKFELYDVDSDWKRFDTSIDAQLVFGAEADMSDIRDVPLRVFSGRLVEQWENLISTAAASANSFEARLSNFDDFLKNNATVRSELARFNLYEDTLKNVINRFLSTVQMYRTAVLAYRTKDLTAKVSVGEELDQLDDIILGEAELQDIKDDLTSALFQERIETHSSIENVRISAREANSRILTNIQNGLRAFREIPRDLPLKHELLERFRPKLSDESLTRIIHSAARASIAAHAKQFNGEISKVIEEQKIKGHEAAVFNIERGAKLVRGVTMIVFLIGIAASSVVWLTRLNDFLGNVASLVLTAVLSLVAPVIARHIAKVWNSRLSKSDYADGKRAVRSAFLRARDETKISIDTKVVKDSLDHMLFSEIQIEGASSFEDTRVSLKQTCEDISQNIGQFRESLLAFQSEYKASTSVLQSWYEPSEMKTALIESMSARIKEQSIEPSFKVLREKKDAVSMASELLRQHEINVGA